MEPVCYFTVLVSRRNLAHPVLDIGIVKNSNHVSAIQPLLFLERCGFCTHVANID